MSKSEKILKSISGLIENGILNSQDIKKEITTDLKFKKDKIINKLELVSREEFEVLKNCSKTRCCLLKKLEKKVAKGKEILTCKPSHYFYPIEYFLRENLLSSTMARPTLLQIDLNFYFYRQKKA